MSELISPNAERLDRLEYLEAYLDGSLREEYSKARLTAKPIYKPRPPRLCVCSICGASFPQIMGRTKKYCGDDCSRTARQKKLADRKRQGLTHRGKDRQRAKYHGVEFQPVKPFKVFERDGWRCQFCGIYTPASERGKLQPNSPEMDHIIPISKGGAHTYENIQTACRSCNQIKGSKIIIKGEGW